MLEDMAIDIQSLKEKLEVMRERKAKLMSMVEDRTTALVNQVQGQKEDFVEARDKVIKFKELRDRF